MNGQTVSKKGWKFRKDEHEEKALITKTDNSFKFVYGRWRDRALQVFGLIFLLICVCVCVCVCNFGKCKMLFIFLLEGNDTKDGTTLIFHFVVM